MKIQTPRRPSQKRKNQAVTSLALKHFLRETRGRGFDARVLTHSLENAERDSSSLYGAR